MARSVLPVTSDGRGHKTSTRLKMPPLAAEDLELDMLQADANSAIRAFLAFRANPERGAYAFACFPTSAFVAEEAHNYFARRRRHARIGSLEGPLFDAFGHSIKKVRAHVKLIDDTDTGAEALRSLMTLVQARSRTLFAHPHNRFVQALSRRFRPDLGAYFVSDHLVATTHTVMPTLGVSTTILRTLGPGSFDAIGRFTYEFSLKLGAFFAQLGRVLGTQGRTITLRPPNFDATMGVTHNDFVGAHFYRHASQMLKDAHPDAIPLLTVCLAQTNQALLLLPTLLGADSSLLFRFQFLTAYHATATIMASLVSPPSWLRQKTNDPLTNRPLRNLLAHYELLGAHKFATRSDPLGSAVAGLAGVDAAQVAAVARERLLRISETLGAGLTKTSLAPVRAFLGDHT